MRTFTTTIKCDGCERTEEYVQTPRVRVMDRDWESNWANVWPAQTAPLDYHPGVHADPREVCRECLTDDERRTLELWQPDMPF